MQPINSICRVCQAESAANVATVPIGRIGLFVRTGPRWTEGLRQKLQELDTAVLNAEVWVVEGLVDVASMVTGDARLLPEERRALESAKEAADGCLLLLDLPKPVSQQLRAALRVAQLNDNSTEADREDMVRFVSELAAEIRFFDLMDEIEFMAALVKYGCVTPPRGEVHARAPPEVVRLCEVMLRLSDRYPGMLDGAWMALPS